MSFFRMGLFFGLFLGLTAFANFGAQTDLEIKIQQKISSVIHPVDPRALVLVNLKFKKVQAPLPGTGSAFSEMFSPPQSEMVQSNEIDKITIKIISSLQPFPPSLRSAVESSLGIGTTKISFVFQEMDPELRKISTAPAVEGMKIWVEPMFREFMDSLYSVFRAFKFLVLVFAVSLLVFLGLGYFLSSKRDRQTSLTWDSAITRLVDAWGGGGGGGRQHQVIAAQPVMKDVSPKPLQIGASDSRSQIHELSAVAIKALLSDCYWCEADGYSAWIWNQMSSQQRQTLLKDWSLGFEYSSHLGKFEPKSQNDHLQSYYLAPSDFSLVSQVDLESWIRRYPEAWSLVSPMRQRQMNLSLQEKMRFSAHKRPTRYPVLPTASLKERDLGSSIQVGTLSDADEISILENPDFIPSEVRAQVFSLVWVALLPKEKRTQLLDSLSAQALSEAWVAAPVVMEKISEVIGDKKRGLIEGYCKVVVPSRHSDTMKFLTSAALAQLEGLQASERNEKIHVA